MSTEDDLAKVMKRFPAGRLEWRHDGDQSIVVLSVDDNGKKLEVSVGFRDEDRLNGWERFFAMRLRDMIRKAAQYDADNAIRAVFARGGSEVEAVQAARAAEGLPPLDLGEPGP